MKRRKFESSLGSMRRAPRFRGTKSVSSQAPSGMRSRSTPHTFGQETVELLRQALANIEAQKEPKGETTEKMSKANLDELQEEVEILFALLKSRDFGLRARDPHVWNGRVQSCLTNLHRLTEQPLK